MLKRKCILILSLAVLAFGCGKKDKEVYKTPVTVTFSQTDNPSDALLLEIVTDKAYVWPGSTDPFEILSQRISGDTLYVAVQYGGGCKDHGFKMSTNLMWLKSKPPQLNLYLEHENNDDNCRALVNRTLAFDLKVIRHSSSDKIRIIVNEDRNRILDYAY